MKVLLLAFMLFQITAPKDTTDPQSVTVDGVKLDRTVFPSLINSLIDCWLEIKDIPAVAPLIAKHNVTITTPKNPANPTKPTTTNIAIGGVLTIGLVTLGDNHPFTNLFIDLIALNDPTVNAKLFTNYKLIVGSTK